MFYKNTLLHSLEVAVLIELTKGVFCYFFKKKKEKEKQKKELRNNGIL